MNAFKSVMMESEKQLIGKMELARPKLLKQLNDLINDFETEYNCEVHVLEVCCRRERNTPMSECITKLYHRAQEMFLELWPNEYMFLID